MKMPRKTVLQGLALAVIGLFFALNSLSYPTGSFAHFGPGRFPLIVSIALLGLAAITLVKSRFDPGEQIHLTVRNIAIVALALGAFVVLSKWVDMASGVVALVFIATTAGVSYSWTRNGLVAAGLIAVALAFEKLLGLPLQVI
jgi:hypothetical protein